MFKLWHSLQPVEELLNMSIKQLFISIFSISILLLVGLAVLIFKLYETQQSLVNSQELRYQSYLAAQELRQSSDDLTKFARTYVVTGEPKYEEMYWNILAIRNGELPRPARYEHIYWDFIAYTNKKPRPDGQTIALKQRLKDLGFTDTEFAKLAEAENNSNALVTTETIAMNAVKGLFDDGKGNFTVKGTPDLEFARQLMHDTHYHQQKFNIMKPIDDFLVLATKRTQMAVQQHTILVYQHITLICVAIIGIIILMLLFYFILMYNLMKQLGGEPAIVAAIAQKIGAGNFSPALFDKVQPLTGLLNTMQEMQNQLRQREEIRVLNEHLRQENTRMGMELEISRQLQQMVLPRREELKEILDLDIASHIQPATEVGGDYYDIIKHGDVVKIAIGDVTGHGLESGVVMLMVQTVVRSLLLAGIDDIKEFLNIVNRTIYANVRRMESDKNLTLALLDYQAGRILVTGQHEEVLVVRKNGSSEWVDTINLGHMVGLQPDIHRLISCTKIHLEVGDGIVLYTDGVTEAHNVNAGQTIYGQERLRQLVCQHWHHPTETICRMVINDVFNYAGRENIFDDITLLIIRRT